MMKTAADLPHIIEDRLIPGSALAPVAGRLGNQIIRVSDVDVGDAYLKIGRGLAGDDLRAEAERLEWLSGKLPVPVVLEKAEVDGAFYLLIGGIPGHPAHTGIDRNAPEKSIKSLAQALALVHATPTYECPFDRVLEKELAECARRINDPGLNLDRFESDTRKQPDQVLEYLFDLAPKIRCNTFTHGDFCFPNLILDGDSLSGIVDWGIAGIGNINRDFMSIEITIKRNCGTEWVEYFYDIYGACDRDDELIRYFWLLDRFFSHYSE